jgi:hypothetical protein
LDSAQIVGRERLSCRPLGSSMAIGSARDGH